MTFDDGYADGLFAASPILSELGIPATFFLTRRCWGGETWSDVLERILVVERRTDFASNG